MAHFIARRRWKSKPPSRSKVNRACPIARGLLRYWQSDSFVDLNGTPLTNDHSTAADADIISTIKGAALNFPDGDGKTLAEANSSPVTGSQDRTFMGLMFYDGAAVGDIFHIHDGTGSGAGERWTVRVDAGTGLRVEIQGSGYTSSLVANTGWHVIGCKLNGTTLADHRLFVDGAFEDATGANSVNTLSTANLRLGNTFTGSTRGTADYIAWGAFWNRALSDAEMLSVYKDPFQLLAPQRHVIDISVAAVGGVTGKSNPLFGPLGGPLAGPIGL